MFQSCPCCRTQRGRGGRSQPRHNRNSTKMTATLGASCLIRVQFSDSDAWSLSAIEAHRQTAAIQSMCSALTQGARRGWEAPIVLLGIALAGLGALSIGAGDFAYQWQPVATALPHRSTFAVASGMAEVAAGFALTVPASRRVGAVGGCAIFCCWTALHIPSVVNKPFDISVWLGAAEPAALALGLFRFCASESEQPSARGLDLWSGRSVRRSARGVWTLAFHLRVVYRRIGSALDAGAFGSRLRHRRGSWRGRPCPYARRLAQTSGAC